jgi:hypothetical protein
MEKSLAFPAGLFCARPHAGFAFVMTPGTVCTHFYPQFSLAFR